MKSIQSIADKTAISLSFICAIHCLLLPVALVLYPALAGLPLGDESFHRWLLMGVVPMSVVALFLGCRKHKRYHVIWKGGIGVGMLIVAAVLGHDVLGEMGEKLITVLAAGLIVIGHWQNHKLCQQKKNCCHETEQ